MKLHEEFKLYEELWEAVEEGLPETDNNSYIRMIGLHKYNLLDKNAFKEYVRMRFYKRGHDGHSSNGRLYFQTVIYPMQEYISKLEWVMSKIMRGIETDKNNGLLNDTMLSTIKSYKDEVMQEANQICNSGEFMIAMEKDVDFYKRYELKFFDIGDPLKAYEFLQQYPSLTEAVYNLLRQNNKQNVIFKLTAMKHNARVGKLLIPSAKSKYYRDNSKYKKPDTTHPTDTTSSSKNPDEYVEYDSFFEDLKEDKDLQHCHRCGKEIRWSKDEVNFNYWGDEELYCEDCWYDLDLDTFNREENDAWIDADTRAVLYAD